MKLVINIKNIPFLLLLLSGYTGYLQPQLSKIDLDKNITTAFNEYKKTHNEAIEYEYEQELKKAYAEGINRLKPDQFDDASAAEKLIQYYSKVDGIKIIIEDWFSSTTQPWDEVFSIDAEIYIKIYFATKNPDENPAMMENAINNYSILFLEIVPSSADLDIYLNDKFIGTTYNAKNGIRMPSGKVYKIELRLGAKKYCSENISLSKQERKIKKCQIN